MGFGTPPAPPAITKHTELTDKEVDGVIDHADASVSDAKLASGVGLSDGQICKLPTATSNQILKRGATAWKAGMEKNPWDDYFYWLCLYESMDGWGDGTSGLSSVSVDATGVRLRTGDVSGNWAELHSSRWGLSFLSWNKLTKMRVYAHFEESLADMFCRLTRGVASYGEAEHIGFRVLNGAVYGTVGNGTAETLLNLGFTLALAESYTFEAVLNPGVECRFYINGVDKGAITTNLPVGPDEFDRVLFSAHMETTADAHKSVYIECVEVWQDK